MDDVVTAPAAAARGDGPAWASPPRRWWARHGEVLLPAVVVLLALLALGKLADEFRRLLWETGSDGAVDLVRYFHPWVQRWFAGDPRVSASPEIVYPPASFALLWPLLGWLPLGAARWLWALTSLALLAWFAAIAARAVPDGNRWQRAFAVLLPLAANATGVTIGNAQLGLHLLPPLLTGVLLLGRPAAWRTDVLAAALFVVALTKPSLSAPFGWLVLWLPGRWRPALLVAAMYLVLTAVAAAYQPRPLWELLAEWLRSGSGWATSQGYASLPLWLYSVGLGDWSLLGALALLLALGGWTWWCRRADVWVLLGIAAIVARLWTYHLAYDNVLLIVVAIALLRIARAGPRRDGADVLAGGLLAAVLLTLLTPARLVVDQAPWLAVVGALHLIIWLAALAFLLWYAARTRSAGSALAGGTPGDEARAPDAMPHTG